MVLFSRGMMRAGLALVPPFNGMPLEPLVSSGGNALTISESVPGGDGTIAEEFLGAVGTATLNFGATPGTSLATVAVTGQTTIVADSAVFAWIQGNDSTVDHNAYEHATVLPMHVKITPISITPGTGFTLQGVNDIQLTGQVAIRWSWK